MFCVLSVNTGLSIVKDSFLNFPVDALISDECCQLFPDSPNCDLINDFSNVQSHTKQISLTKLLSCGKLRTDIRVKISHAIESKCERNKVNYLSCHAFKILQSKAS